MHHRLQPFILITTHHAQHHNRIFGHKMGPTLSNQLPPHNPKIQVRQVSPRGKVSQEKTAPFRFFCILHCLFLIFCFCFCFLTFYCKLETAPFNNLDFILLPRFPYTYTNVHMYTCITFLYGHTISLTIHHHSVYKYALAFSLLFSVCLSVWCKHRVFFLPGSSRRHSNGGGGALVSCNDVSVSDIQVLELNLEGRSRIGRRLTVNKWQWSMSAAGLVSSSAY